MQAFLAFAEQGGDMLFSRPDLGALCSPPPLRTKLRGLRRVARSRGADRRGAGRAAQVNNAVLAKAAERPQALKAYLIEHASNIAASAITAKLEEMLNAE